MSKPQRQCHLSARQWQRPFLLSAPPSAGKSTCAFPGGADLEKHLEKHLGPKTAQSTTMRNRARLVLNLRHGRRLRAPRRHGLLAHVLQAVAGLSRHRAAILVLGLRVELRAVEAAHLDGHLSQGTKGRHTEAGIWGHRAWAWAGGPQAGTSRAQQQPARSGAAHAPHTRSPLFAFAPRATKLQCYNAVLVLGQGQGPVPAAQLQQSAPGARRP